MKKKFFVLLATIVLFLTFIIQSVFATTYMVNVDDCLRLRSAPSTDSNIYLCVPANSFVDVTEVCENWGKVTYEGITGWLCLDYLVKASEMISSSSSSRPVPVGSSMISQKYLGSTHKGIDIASYGDRNVDIYAVDSGVVCEAVGNGEWNGGMGNYVKINHFDRYTSIYMHLQNACVCSGQAVSSGQKIVV